MKKVFILCILCAGIMLAQDMVIRVYAPNWQDLEKISPKYDLDIAGARAGQYYDIVADQDVLSQIRSSGIPYEIIVFSIAHAAEQVRASYMSYSEMCDSLDAMIQSYPSICKLDSFPITTYQGNWIYGVKISDNVYIEEDDEPGFLIDGQHHANEWACMPTVLFFIDSILSSYGVVGSITDMINSTELYCFPVLNVDGYLYDYPGGNYWRKNREPFSGATGTDPNRNYAGCTEELEGEWGAVDNGKATHRPQSSIFSGAYVNSGDETRAMTLYAQDHFCNVYMTYHSSGEMLCWPWGWKYQQTPDSALYDHFGNNAADLVQRLGGGTYYRGTVSNIIYRVSGSSMDWFYAWSRYVNGVSNISFTTELGTSQYQSASNLDHIIHQNFKALEYLAGICDSVVLLVRTLVPPPTIYPLGTVGEDFTIYWHAKNPVYNEPIQWELVELSAPSIIEDDLESGTDRWILDGFTLSTTQAHSGSNSFFSGNIHNMNHAVCTAYPYLVQAGDSVTFWCWYDLETNYDVAVVEVSENTKEWCNLDTTRFNGNQTSWVRKEYSLEDWAGKSVYIRFRSMTDGAELNSGFYVDDIYPVCLYANVDTISSSIPDTFYEFTSHAQGEYFYYVKGYNTAYSWGDYSCLEKVNVLVGIVETPSSESYSNMSSFTLSPNPFREMTNLQFQFSIGQGAESIELKIYDATGRLVKDFSRLTPDALRPTQIIWDGTDQNDRKVPAGVYFVSFKAGDYKKVEKAILLR